MSNLIIDGNEIKLGERKRISINVATLYDFTEVNIPIEVIRGKEDGPTLFISACIHGDEINSVEIVKRLLSHKSIKNLKGTLIAIPIVNVFGFNDKSRYLPDRRDLNRCFPGTEKGSLASQIAYKFTNEIVKKSDYGIDLHTGAIHRNNLPQIRACLDDPRTKELAQMFNVPVLINSDIRDGSLRQSARELNIPVVLFEGGEALRFNEKIATSALQGILSLMCKIGMLSNNDYRPIKKKETFIARSSYWVRAPHSGTIILKKKLGDYVKKNQLIGIISDPFGQHKFKVTSNYEGIIIGLVTLPLLNNGDAIAHIATFKDAEKVEENINIFEEQIDNIDVLN
ncbi:MAG: putative deacylase [Rickettsiales bacterium]|jgi:predicted deacylase